ncbi:hypothetical protein B0H11DRAFT_1909116 [Mycena galericulata]|nr:hypothetical protein B0H11DRAFT_1909116 [Mycena galericulata]
MNWSQLHRLQQVRMCDTHRKLTLCLAPFARSRACELMTARVFLYKYTNLHTSKTPTIMILHTKGKRSESNSDSDPAYFESSCLLALSSHTSKTWTTLILRAEAPLFVVSPISSLRNAPALNHGRTYRGDIREVNVYLRAVTSFFPSFKHQDLDVRVKGCGLKNPGSAWDAEAKISRKHKPDFHQMHTCFNCVIMRFRQHHALQTLNYGRIVWSKDLGIVANSSRARFGVAATEGTELPVNFIIFYAPPTTSGTAHPEKVLTVASPVYSYSQF